MTMRRAVRIRAVREAEAGFVLIGVIMFILVLTILGLSLFSLSGFESQFFNRSYRGSRAFYAAVGGLDRARWVLLKTDSLGLVGASLPDSVIETKAYQEQGGDVDSAGRIVWGGEDVLIRVTAANNGQRQVVEGRFSPTKAPDYYKRLITLSGDGSPPDIGLWIKKDDGVGDIRWSQTWLEGEVWQNAPSPGPLCDQFQVSGPFSWITPIGGVPNPEVQAYWDAHQSGVSTPLQTLPYDYHLDAGGPTGIRFFKTPYTGGQWSVELDKGSPSDLVDVNITVTGTVIWMLEGGLFTDRLVRVHGTPGATNLLVLVGVKSFPSPHPGTELCLFGGLDSPTVPVILVASDMVQVQHVANDPNFDKNSAIDYLSIYARSATIMGPSALAPSHSMILRHEFNATPDQSGGAVDRLYQLGLLPNIPAGANRDLPLRAGTWRQIAQNN